MVSVPEWWFHRNIMVIPVIILALCILLVVVMAGMFAAWPEAIDSEGGRLAIIWGVTILAVAGILTAFLGFHRRYWQRREAAIVANYDLQIAELRGELREFDQTRQKLGKAREALRGAQKEHNELWKCIKLLFERSVDFQDFTRWLLDDPELLDKLCQRVGSANVSGFAEMLEQAHESFKPDREEWRLRKSREEQELDRKRRRSHVWMRRLMHQIFWAAGQLENMNRASPELLRAVRRVQDELVLKVLEALADVIHVHRELNGLHEAHIDSGDAWPTDLPQEGVQYVLAAGHNDTEDLRCILRGLQDHRAGDLEAHMAGMPEDVRWYLMKVLLGTTGPEIPE